MERRRKIAVKLTEIYQPLRETGLWEIVRRRLEGGVNHPNAHIRHSIDPLRLQSRKSSGWALARE
jgi:hypothetical protein